MLSLKPIEFLGSSRRALLAFPNDARRMAEFQLDRIQRGLDPFDWKVMPGVGAGAMELRGAANDKDESIFLGVGCD